MGNYFNRNPFFGAPAGRFYERPDYYFYDDDADNNNHDESYYGYGDNRKVAFVDPYQYRQILQEREKQRRIRRQQQQQQQQLLLLQQEQQRKQKQQREQKQLREEQQQREQQQQQHNEKLNNIDQSVKSCDDIMINIITTFNTLINIESENIKS